ncbi:ATP-binding cassette domain-containing protein [Mycoplasmatota bacterium]|nr:ATP-binding cassette domain-containing protein [Mycoplasmatota bacterium]
MRKKEWRFVNENREVLLEVKNLKQYFHIGGGSVVKAVDDVSFEIYKGETFGLVGESGSGKSTTGRSIIRLYEPTGGEIFYKGERIAVGHMSIDGWKKDILKMKKGQSEESDQMTDLKELIKTAKHDNIVKSDLRKSMQMIFQDPMASLNPRLRVVDIVAEGIDVHHLIDTKGLSNKARLDKREEKVFKLLEKVGLSRDHAGRYPHEFSGGQRQRIGIARALITNPDFIIADEPISALDVSIQAQVVNLLNDLKEEFGLTYLFIAHDLSMVKYISDRIGVMHLGKLVELGTSDHINDNPFHPYTKSLLSAIPLPDPDYEQSRTRIHYDKNKVDYNKGQWIEVEPNHFVLGTVEEVEEWKKSGH